MELTVQRAGMLFGIFCIVFCIGQTVVFWKTSCRKNENRIYIQYIFIAALTVGLAAYGGMLQRKHYSVDSMNVWSNMGAAWHLQLGRYSNFAVIIMAGKLGINTVASQQFFLFLWIVTMAVMHAMIMESISDCLKQVSVKQYLLILLSVMLSFVNVFSMELMLFPETAMWMSIGNLALGLSIKDSIGSGGIRRRWIIAAVELFVALGCYQSYIGVYEVFVLMGFFLKYHDEKKIRYEQSFIALVIGGGNSLLNVLIVRILVKFSVVPDAGRESGLKNMLSNMKTICRYQINFWKDADGILPLMAMPVCLGVLFAISVIILKKQKAAEQKIYFVLMVIGGYLLAFAPHLIETTAYLTPRSNLAVWSVIAVVLILGIYYEGENRLCSLGGGINLFVVFFMVIHICAMTNMIANETAVNAVDFSEARAIACKIKEYESETGNYITKIGTTQDTDCTFYSTETQWENYQLGARIMAVPHSNYLLVSYVMERKMESVEMPDVVREEYFQGKDWNNLNISEQVVCMGDTVYICIY